LHRNAPPARSPRNGQSFSRFDDAGERTFLDENERNAEIERTRKAMERTCKQ